MCQTKNWEGKENEKKRREVCLFIATTTSESTKADSEVGGKQPTPAQALFIHLPPSSSQV